MLVVMRNGIKAGRLLAILAAAVCSAEELPLVTSVEFQPLAAQVSRVMQTLDMIGEPLPAGDARQLKEAKTVEQIQRVLDKYCLAGVDINPESRVKVQQGPAKAELVEQGWRRFSSRFTTRRASRRCSPWTVRTRASAERSRRCSESALARYPELRTSSR